MADAEDATTSAPLRLKIEINTREVECYDGPRTIAHTVDNPWFSGSANVPTFTIEELLATKLRALLQRNKGRDLFDLAQGLELVDELDCSRVVKLLGDYLAAQEISIPRAEAERRMFAKLANTRPIDDIRPLLSATVGNEFDEHKQKHAFASVFRAFIQRLPGKPWKKTIEMAQRFDVPMLSL